MSDRQDEVLNSIDTALAQCICGRPVPENGPSLDYCSDVCQYRFIARQAGVEPDPELLYPIPAADTDGRRINAAVNTWVSRSANNLPFDYYDDSLYMEQPVRSWSITVPMRNISIDNDGLREIVARLETDVPPRRPVDRFSVTRAAGSDSIPVCLSPAEAMIPGPNGPIHVRGAYGDQPMQVTGIDPDDVD
jgi:hypothetical protein